MILGTLSDGDIRAALLGYTSLSNKVDKFYNRKATIVQKGKFKITEIKNLLIKKDLQLIPVVNKKNILIDILYWSQVFGAQKINFPKIKLPVVIMAGGTGNPYFTTDTAAVLRAIEIDADVVIKATKVDGIYSEDPVKNPAAIKYPKISFKEVIEKELKVMDMTAVTLCRENNLPIIVFNINDDQNLDNLIKSKHVGTLVS